MFNVTFKRLVIIAILFDFASLPLPWWTFLFVVDGKAAASFNLFLWGVLKEGFVTAQLPHQWHSYSTFIMIAVGTIAGLIGYKFSKNMVMAKGLLSVNFLMTLGGCALFLFGLLSTFSTFFIGLQNVWMIAPTNGSGLLAVGLYSIFHVSFYQMYGAVMLEFLSIGFLLAVISAIFSLIAMYKITKPHGQVDHEEVGHLNQKD